MSLLEAFEELGLVEKKKKEKKPITKRRKTEYLEKTIRRIVREEIQAYFSRKQSERHKRTQVDEETIERVLEVIREYDKTKRKRRKTHRRFVPIELLEYIKKRRSDIKIDLRELRFALLELFKRGLLNKYGARYELVS